MLYTIKNRDDLEKLEELASLKNQVNERPLQDKSGKQKFHSNMKKLYEPPTDTIKNISRDITKTMMETSINNKKALGNLNNKILERMNDRGIIASYLLSPSFKITNPEHTS